MGKINTTNYPNRPVSAYQDDDMFILQDNGGETYTTNVGDIKTLIDNRVNDSNLVHKTGDETILGDKTFEDDVNVEGGITAGTTSTFNDIDMDGSSIYGVGTLNVNQVDVHDGQAIEFLSGINVNGDVTDEDGNVLSDKTDKVESAVAGHLAGLDANGNLTDSGVSPTEDVTVEGNPVTFDSPFEQDAKSVVVSVKPIQAGSGTPSPENIRPISGIDEVEIGVSGKNLLPLTASFPQTIKGVTFSKDDNGAITAIRTSANNSNADFVCSSLVLKAGTYTYFAGNYGSGSTFQTSIQIDGVNRWGVSAYTFTLTKDSEIYIICRYYSDYSGTAKYEPQIVLGTEATSYEPHKGSTTTIPLPSTLYGGTVDVDTGEATVTHGYIASYNGETLPGAWISDRDEYTGSNSPTTGAEVAYELATPTTISLTPTDVELLEGTNVVSTNGEKVAVTYRRSLWQDINDLKTDTEGKLNKSDVADVEGDTASKAYSVNDFMLRADGFYKVTQPIASGASITNSNTTKTTIGAVLTALLNS